MTPIQDWCSAGHVPNPAKVVRSASRLPLVQVQLTRNSVWKHSFMR